VYAFLDVQNMLAMIFGNGPQTGMALKNANGWYLYSIICNDRKPQIYWIG
jgi:hypothetical protein